MNIDSTNKNPTPIPMLDIRAGNQLLLDEIMDGINQVCQTGYFVGGPNVAEAEQLVAQLSNVDHAIGCASGSDALLLSLMAIDIQPGDEVIVPSFTFFATASAVWRLGAKPVFADIDPKSYCIDPKSIASCVTDKTKAIIPVHLFGQCCDMDAIMDIANAHDLRVIEDSAQSIGATYKGKPCGSFGDTNCISFYPTKNLGGFGDGGMVTTDNEELAKRVRRLANHGMDPRYYHSEVGINSRLDSIQAVAIKAKAKYVDRFSIARSENAVRYQRLFAQHGLEHLVEAPQQLIGRGHVWNQYTIRVHHGLRDKVRQRLTDAKIGTDIYYPVPLHLQECFASLGYSKNSLRTTEQAANEVLSLPIYGELPEEHQAIVVKTLAKAASELLPRRLAS